jgi:hypothetical protein
MTQDQTAHSIDKAEINVHLNDYPANVDTDELRRWTVRVLLEEFDAVVTEICPPDRWYALHSLSIDVELPGEDFLNSGPSLRSALRAAFRMRIRENIESGGGQSEAEYFTNIVLEYLASGNMPSARRATRLHAALTLFIENLVTMDRVRQTRIFEMLRRADVFTRFLRHAGTVPLFELLSLRSGDSPDIWRRVVRALPQVLQRHPTRFRLAGHDDVLRLMFAVLPVVETAGTDSFRNILRRLLAALRIDSHAQHETAAPFPVDPGVMADLAEALSSAGVATDTETAAVLFSLTPAEISSGAGGSTTHPPVTPPSPLHVASAGIVLLAPFLKSFLAAVDGLNPDGSLVTPERVPLLLHYLATGERSAEEWQLTLPKLLAGLDVSDICDTELYLTEEEVLQATELLHSVISLWNKLQGTSIEGLRETFLKRQGTLSPQAPHWRLRVQEETVDILLQFVPWPFHTIRLPWMRGILLVDW